LQDLLVALVSFLFVQPLFCLLQDWNLCLNVGIGLLGGLVGPSQGEKSREN